ncbi:MAG: helical backbone metal receptor [Dermatophilus congolensis]|nr:helical backbone metal receptor [Dermatophilus congolensis]
MDRPLLDDLGAPVQLVAEPRRVVSLVPSITEAIAETAPGSLVGATDWCVQPADLDVARVRGTKNPDLAAIRELRPDLVVANHEENRRIDVERLRESGVTVWVTRIDTVQEALDSLARLFREGFGHEAEPGWLTTAREVWDAPPTPSLQALRVAVPIWRDPWSWVGSQTYADDVLGRIGLVNVVARLDARYPRLDVETVLAEKPDVVLLPDEPYAFGPTDGPDVFPHHRHEFVEGRTLFWYGPSMARARADLESTLAR